MADATRVTAGMMTINSKGEMLHALRPMVHVA
jgi:hypothetical protein